MSRFDTQGFTVTVYPSSAHDVQRVVRQAVAQLGFAEIEIFGIEWSADDYDYEAKIGIQGPALVWSCTVTGQGFTVEVDPSDGG